MRKLILLTLVPLLLGSAAVADDRTEGAPDGGAQTEAPADAQTDGQTETGAEQGAQAPQGPIEAPMLNREEHPELDPNSHIVENLNKAQAALAQALDRAAQAKEELEAAEDKILAERKTKDRAILESDAAIKEKLAPIQKKVDDAEYEAQCLEGRVKAFSLLRGTAKRGDIRVIEIPVGPPPEQAPPATVQTTPAATDNSSANKSSSKKKRKKGAQDDAKNVIESGAGSKPEQQAETK